VGFEPGAGDHSDAGVAVIDAVIAACLVFGGILVAVGVAMWAAPAGVVVAGLELIVTAYAFAYLKARGTPG
jgi:hypothetical protein